MILNPKPLKNLLLFFILFTLIGCKNDSKEDKNNIDTEQIQNENVDSLKVSDRDIEKQLRTLNLKRRALIDKKDQREELDNLIISKSFYQEDDKLIIDFEYPYLNEALNPSFSNFNEYINKNYIDIKSLEKQMAEEKRLCDAMGIPQGNEKRIVEYKIYNLNDRLISILFYKENHYAGAAHASYTFETLNFDLAQSSFMKFEDFFNNGVEEELREILNGILNEKINSGDMYYDCWSISNEDFFLAKNNFVITEEAVEYYFDDCVICPSYTGTYSIKIPLEMLKPVLRNHKRNPLLN